MPQARLAHPSAAANATARDIVFMVPSWSFAATMTRAPTTRKSEVLSFCQHDPRHFAAR
jgi:hypothetical protein